MSGSVKNMLAPDGKVWVCAACGKMSRDRYGDSAISYGWDESCFLHAFLADRERLTLSQSGERAVRYDSGARHG